MQIAKNKILNDNVPSLIASWSITAWLSQLQIKDDRNQNEMADFPEILKLCDIT